MPSGAICPNLHPFFHLYKENGFDVSVTEAMNHKGQDFITTSIK